MRPAPTLTSASRILVGRRLLVAFAAMLMLASLPFPTVGASARASGTARVSELASFAASGCTGPCGSGSTIGPDGALYVTDGPGGRLLRVDRRTGRVLTITDHLPRMLPGVGLGGPIDVAFLGHTPYVLVTLVGPVLGQPDVVAGIYRVASDGSPRAVVDLGQWSVAHPPATDHVVASGLQYAMEPYGQGFLVTDGHLNRLLYATVSGRVSEVRAFGNVVPTGLDLIGDRIVMAEAGPVPHRPETGRLITWRPDHQSPTVLAAGASLLVDVEVADGRLWALSQGVWDHPDLPENAGLPASPETGRLVRADRGRLVPVVSGIDRPTSMELVGKRAYVITMNGKVLRVSLR